MLISCPKCKSVYEVEAEVVPERGRKMKCCSCGEVFLCQRSDALIERLMDLENIVPEYIKKQAEEIMETEETSQKSLRNMWLMLLSFVLFFSVFALIFMRFEVVRIAPFMEKAYDFVGLESIYRGQGLEFVNIKRSEYVEDNVSKMQITGEIYNTGKYTVLVPNINLQIIDKNNNMVLFEEHEIELNRLEADNTLSFKIITVNPTPYAKSVYLTFAEK